MCNNMLRSYIIFPDSAAVHSFRRLPRTERIIQIQFRLLFFLQQFIHLLLSLLEVIGSCEPGSCWHQRYLHLSIKIHLSHEFGCWIAGPILIFEQFLLHAVRVCLGFDLFVAAEDAFL